ncbi:MAG: tetratricopeptide repeat protein [Candidatus Muiribacteriota bacterium]
MKKTTVLFVIIFYSFFYIYAQNIEENLELFSKGQELFEKEEYKEAISIFEQIKSFFSNTAEGGEIYYKLGKSYLRLNNLEKAVLNFKNYQKFFSYGEHIAEVDAKLSELEDIQSYFKEIPEETTESSTYMEKARKAKDIHLYDTAIKYLKKAVELETENPVYHMELALLYNKKHNITSYNPKNNYMKNELEQYEEITKHISSPEINYNKAVLYFRTGDFENAENLFKKVIEGSSNSFQAKSSQIYLNKISNL